MQLQQVKQRFEIIGNSHGLNRVIELALQVAPTDLSVLISGESGVGKERIPQIIHSYSSRKHGEYIAVNCGAIPEGTIDSELFGHIKGSFTSAINDRKGYFEVADKGTIFLDEVSELPLATQVRLLRVLETGEFIRVGSSKTQKTDVRVIAATNVNILEAVKQGKFREDLYYRLNTVPIFVPPLRDRKEDIYLLFRKFAADFAEKYRMPSILLSDDAQEILLKYRWPGNIRQLKNITEQISVIEEQRLVSAKALQEYLPGGDSVNLPAIYNKQQEQSFSNEREILYKILFDMKKDVTELKKLVYDIILENPGVKVDESKVRMVEEFYNENDNIQIHKPVMQQVEKQEETQKPERPEIEDTKEFEEENLCIADKEMELIRKALEKYKGKRRKAAEELGISERTLYRKIKEYNIEH
jgi:transcriptional regulator with PAS, ATPase and Fis domain